jgi:hypothetical protein
MNENRIAWWKYGMGTERGVSLFRVGQEFKLYFINCAIAQSPN